MTDGLTPAARSLHRKLAQVMYEAERIPKNGTAPPAMGGFKFVQVGDAADFIRKALAEKVISMVPTKVTITGQAEHQTKTGGTMTTVDMIVDWTLTDGESGESITIQSFGAGADGGDKYSGKAQTNAMKYALLMGFLLSTGDDPELSDSSDRRPKRSGWVSDKPFGDDPLPGRGGPLEPRDPREDAADPMYEPTHGDGLIGIAEVGKGDADFELRQTPDGMRLAFRLTAGRKGWKVITTGQLAEAVAALRVPIEGQRVTVWGRMMDETFTPKGMTKPIVYQVVHAERIQTPDYVLPATVELTPEERDAIAGSLPDEAPTEPLGLVS
jgi:hypothetical protein